ncbi:alpha/beta fold hydrolase [Pseudomonas schmalbachii]|uniref:Alpha/beta hydrolase n=1 Tax=Pseudomonas schmalbachii TaxID=2816993 RepID=A0ABS3TPV8_9PSED|nr:alpha/beta hydrolase [Pseudomonas schmalbachii]MBO3275687.1 alpha/beta hydrolase [Pseudomonas schmalbachii]
MQPRITQEDLWIETPHGRMFARRWRPDGQGDATGQAPFILFHDSLGCVELWRDFPGQLAAATGREVIAYDRLGYGRSDAHPGGWSPDFIRDEAQRYFPLLRESLDLGHFIAFGHSVGGAMAATCASLYPHACLALITESAQAFVEDRTLHGIRQAKEDFRKPGQIERLQKYHGDKARWVLEAWTETWLSGEFADWTIERTVSSVNCPLLVIHGEEDEYGSLCHPPRIARLTSASSESLILPGCHHVPHREMPGQVLEAVIRFLQASHR